MAHSLQAKKRVRQNEKARRRNKGIKSTIKTQIKNVKTAISESNSELAGKEFVKLQKLVDKAGAKKVIHKNTAGRIKSRIGKKVRLINSEK